MRKKLIRQVSFVCQSQSCPKHLDTCDPYDKKFYKLMPPISNQTVRSGCQQLRSTIWLLSPGPMSDVAIENLKTVGVVLPCPDPTGAQGMGGGYGVGMDIICEQIYRANGNQPVKVAIFFLTRGYSFNKRSRNDLIQAPLNKAAISNCYPYLENDIQYVKPEKLLFCGIDVANMFFQGKLEIAKLRRDEGLSTTIGLRTYPVQVTFNPHLASVAPVYIKPIYEDCRKLFETPIVAPKTEYRILRTVREADEYLDFLSEHEGYISTDAETKNLNRKAPNPIATIQFATDGILGVVLPYQHPESPFSPDELKHLHRRLSILFRKPIFSKGWIAHNAKFENMIFHRHFGSMMKSADIMDTQAMAFLQDETRSERKADVPSDGGIYTLKQLAFDYLNFRGYDRGILKIRKEGNLFELPLEELADYGGMDAAVTYRLFYRIRELAREENYEEQLMKLTRKFYGPITKLTAHIEMTGFKTNLKYLRQMAMRSGPFEQRMQELEEKLRNTEEFHEANKIIIGERTLGNVVGVMGTIPWALDFSKVDHQALAFYKVMGLEPVSFSEKTGRPGIDEDFFNAYREEFKVVELFEQYNETKNMRDTFLNKILDRVDPEIGDEDCRIDQRIRPDIHYTRLVTGRLVMVNPNMGQIPKAEENLADDTFGVRKAIKDIFTVDKGASLLQVDYKVNEVRWAAIIAQDVALATIFNDAAKRIVEARISGDPAKIKDAEFLEDIHRNTASAAFGVSIYQVTKQQRQAAKAITFGILFQQSAKALALAIGVTEDEALEFQARFFAKMTGVEKMIADLKTQAVTKGYVEAPHGRRRRFYSMYLPDSFPNKHSQEARNLRQGVNSPIQGIASDAAMYGGAWSLLEYIDRHNKDWLIQNVVHDSCLIQINDAAETADAIMVMESIFVDEAMRKMEGLGVKFNLPLGIDVEGGIPKWGSLSRWNGTRESAEELQRITLDYWSKI